MATNMIYVIIVIALLISTVVVAVISHKELNNPDNIDLIQGKLENSDSSIADAMNYLKITNKGKQ